jgi:hypothetical protein
VGGGWGPPPPPPPGQRLVGDLTYLRSIRPEQRHSHDNREEPSKILDAAQSRAC